MSETAPRISHLERIYHEYQANQNSAAYIRKVAECYTTGTLERLLTVGPRLARRAAALAMGFLADYESNHVLGMALCDDDRGVRLLVENAIRAVWCRQGTAPQQQQLGALIRLNASQQFETAIERASAALDEAPHLAEAWNQRAIAHYSLGHYQLSIDDCRQAVELNPYHFGAVAGMGQCYLQLGNHLWALESFRRALALNPSLEGIRANITSIEAKLKRS